MNELSLEATHLELRKIGPWLAEMVDEGDLGGIELGVHELAVNSVDHAQDPDQRLTLRGIVDAGQLLIEMVDRGVAFDVAAVKVPEDGVPQVRGYGLMILEQLASDVRYDRIDGENRWTVIFDLSD